MISVAWIVNHELEKVTDGYVSYALFLKHVLLHLTFSLALVMILRNPPSVSIKVGIWRRQVQPLSKGSQHRLRSASLCPHNSTTYSGRKIQYQQK